MKIFTNKQLIDLHNSVLHKAGETNDNRFAVIAGIHYDLTDYNDCEGKDYSVITVYNAEDVNNISNTAGAESEENIIFAYVSINDHKAALDKFKALIAEALEAFE